MIKNKIYEDIENAEILDPDIIKKVEQEMVKRIEYEKIHGRRRHYCPKLAQEIICG